MLIKFFITKQQVHFRFIFHARKIQFFMVQDTKETFYLYLTYNFYSGA